MKIITMSDIDKTIEESYKNITDKIYKLTEAVYKVTDLFSDKEPLKWTIRNSSVDLYTKSMSIKTDQRALNDVLDSLHQIINILELASSGTFVSSINFDILKKEYMSVMSFIEGRKDKLILEPKLLLESISSIGQSLETKDIDKKQSIVSVKKPVTDTKNKTVVRFQKPKASGTVGSDRKDKILNFLKENDKKTIKEIAVIFDNISEKTVQRDLLDLVKIGKIKTEGEKRWRFYSII